MSRAVHVILPIAGVSFPSSIHPSFISNPTQFSFQPLQKALTKTTSLMETIVSNSMPISVSSLLPVRAVASPRKLQLSSFTPKTTLFGSGSQRKLGFRCSPVRRAAVTCGGVMEIKENQFSDVVLKADGPVLVEFVATWCGPCRLISPAMESIAQEYRDRLTVVKIDHDANPQLIEEYKVYGLPTLILFKNGKEVPESRREGAITKAKLKEYVDALLESMSVA